MNYELLHCRSATHETWEQDICRENGERESDDWQKTLKKIRDLVNGQTSPFWWRLVTTETSDYNMFCARVDYLLLKQHTISGFLDQSHPLPLSSRMQPWKLSLLDDFPQSKFHDPVIYWTPSQNQWKPLNKRKERKKLGELGNRNWKARKDKRVNTLQMGIENGLKINGWVIEWNPRGER